jgi:thiamine-monophosphate kinase
VRSSELARVAALRARLETSGAGGGIRVGIGDDAAVLEAIASGALVWTVDAQVDGTHFRSDWVSWEDVGWRSFMAAASDLAAMGAEPVAALSSLVLTNAIDDEALDAIARGQADAARTVGAPVVGGNLARGTETSITTTLLGRAETPVLRSGALAGDGVWLAGPIGLAAAGLAVLEQAAQSVRSARNGGRGVLDDAAAAECLRAWRRPVARIAEGRALAGVARAAIDVSDGLAHDAWQLATASDVRIVLDLAAVLAAGGDALASGAALVARSPEELALHGGEDYAIVAASAVALPGFVRVGSVETFSADPHQGARVLVRTAAGIAPVEPRGFDHFG